MTPRLPACTPRDVERVLLRLGFVPDRQVGSHRTFLNFVDRRRVTLPMHNRDLKTPTLRAIIKQAGVTREEFHAFLRGKGKKRSAI